MNVMDITKLSVGDKVYYDVFPDGVNIEGIIIKGDNDQLSIKAVGKDKAQFDKLGVSPIVDLNDVNDVRWRKNA